MKGYAEPVRWHRTADKDPRRYACEPDPSAGIVLLYPNLTRPLQPYYYSST
jgi:hypothetical protein